MYRRAVKTFLWIIIISLFLTSCSKGLLEKQPAVETAESAEAEPDSRLWPTDGWIISSPEEQGMDGKILEKADAYIKSDFPNIYSLLVVRHGRLVYEKYYQGLNENNMVPVFSVTKSVMSALTGIAVREKHIRSIHDKLSHYLPEYFTSNVERDKKNIDIENLLTMTAGFEPDSENLLELLGSDDWLGDVMRKPLASKPGSKFNYSTGSTHLLSVVLTGSSGMSTLDYARKYLFSPLGINNFVWETDPKGYYFGGHGLFMIPRDMAKLGYLYLNKGYWSGSQIIPESWIIESTGTRVKAGPDISYGYLWWLSKLNHGKDGNKVLMYSASGYGGQYIDVIPQQDMVIVITANPLISSKNGADAREIVKRYVLPAVEDGKIIK